LLIIIISALICGARSGHIYLLESSILNPSATMA